MKTQKRQIERKRMRDKKRDRECEKESERERKRGRTFEDTNKISFSGKQIEVSKIQYGH